MARVLKVYPDGSQITTTNLAVAAAITITTTVTASYLSVKFNDWRNIRWHKKNAPLRKSTKR